MYRFKAEIDRLRNDDGSTAYVGARWTERAEGTIAIVGLFAVILALAWPSALLLLFNGPYSAMEITSVLGWLSFITGLVAWMGWEDCAKHRSVYFLADGRVHFPDGILRRWRKHWLVAEIGDIQGFQVQEWPNRQKPQTQPTYYVRLYLKNGDMLLVTEGHEDWQAHKIVTLLTSAYREMMDARASLSRRAGYADGIVTELVVE